MASTINAKTTGVGGIDASGDASGVLALQTGGTTALTISTAQVVSFTNAITLTSSTLTTPTIDSAQVPTVSGTAPLYMCRAWVNFNGTGTPAITASGNVSSITDNGVGDYTVNFTTAMSDANYCSVANSAKYDTNNDANQRTQVGGYVGALQTSGATRVRTTQGILTGAVDPTMIFVAVFR